MAEDFGFRVSGFGFRVSGLRINLPSRAVQADMQGPLPKDWIQTRKTESEPQSHKLRAQSFGVGVEIQSFGRRALQDEMPGACLS